jgi:hypothetical protein
MMYLQAHPPTAAQERGVLPSTAREKYGPNPLGPGGISGDMGNSGISGTSVRPTPIIIPILIGLGIAALAGGTAAGVYWTANSASDAKVACDNAANLGVGPAIGNMKPPYNQGAIGSNQVNNQIYPANGGPYYFCTTVNGQPALMKGPPPLPGMPLTPLAGGCFQPVPGGYTFGIPYPTGFYGWGKGGTYWCNVPVALRVPAPPLAPQPAGGCVAIYPTPAQLQILQGTDQNAIQQLVGQLCTPQILLQIKAQLAQAN